jgi:shikimate kinase
MTQIILIGPPGTGKSTLGKLLSQKLGFPQVSLDELRWGYYAERGYNAELAQQLREKQGFPALIQYWKLFDAYAVERVLADHSYSCVIDFGAGHSMYEDDADLKRIKQVLSSYQSIVVLLLPSQNMDESVQILTERQLTMAPPEDHSVIRGLIEHHVKHHSNHELSNIVIYTKGKTPQETCEELIDRLKL